MFRGVSQCASSVDVVWSREVGWPDLDVAVQEG
jgi:hypothetical protein